MSQESLAAPAVRGTVQSTWGERVLILRVLDQSAPKTLEATRQSAAAYDAITAGLSTDKLVEQTRDLDLTLPAAREPSPIELSRQEAHTLIELVRSTLERGQTPGVFARMLLALHDKLTLFVS